LHLLNYRCSQLRMSLPHSAAMRSTKQIVRKSSFGSVE
jgi:hypothetical protein